MLAAAAAVLLLSSCTTAEQGLPAPTNGGQEPQTTTEAELTAELPKRPRDLKLDSVDPCKLLVPAQQAELKVGRVRPYSSTSETYRGAKGCAFEVKGGQFYDYDALLVTTEGADAWLKEKRNVEMTPGAVADYGAITYRLKGEGPNSAPCTTTIDVADGQQLQVTTSTMGKDFTQDQVCEMSEKAASLVLTTLKTLA
ncbi:Protein of unknown function (DUF3558) [Actinokineospora globicatena]|nr:Protein of unknown function (DUF3558) [Actinokineospora globicatena]GLW76924.1 hypothetical protein Aglo01_14060 [Actinokineospora globicatena]GLW83757.1 hypothetical protein Aglo02_13970 [Actinokineospora globicatena]